MDQIEKDIRDSIREARLAGKLDIASVVLGCNIERLEQIDGGDEITDFERRWFNANLELSGA